MSKQKKWLIAVAIIVWIGITVPLVIGKMDGGGYAAALGGEVVIFTAIWNVLPKRKTKTGE